MNKNLQILLKITTGLIMLFISLNAKTQIPNLDGLYCPNSIPQLYSANNSKHEFWDTNVPKRSLLDAVPLEISNNVFDLKLIEVDGSQFGFVVSEDNRLYRLSYSNSLEPEIEELTSFSSQLNFPISIDIFKFESMFYISILNFRGNSIVLGKFENGIENEPKAIVNPKIPNFSNPRSLNVSVKTDSIFFFVCPQESQSFTKLSFSGDLVNTIPNMEIIETNISTVVNSDIIRHDSIFIHISHSTVNDINISIFDTNFVFIENWNVTYNTPEMRSIQLFKIDNKIQCLLLNKTNIDLFNINFRDKRLDRVIQNPVNQLPFSIPIASDFLKNDNEFIFHCIDNVDRDTKELYPFIITNTTTPFEEYQIIEYTAFDTISNVNIYLRDTAFIYPRANLNIVDSLSCNDTSTILFNRFSNNNSIISSYKWILPDSTITTSTDTIIVSSFSKGNKQIYLKTTDICSRKDSITTTINIVDKDDITASFDFTDTLCTQALVDLKNTSSFNQDSISSNEWLIRNNLNDTLFSSLDSNTQFTFPEQEDYTIYLKSTGKSGCGDDTLLTVSPFQGPPASFSFTDTCFGQTFTAFENTADLGITEVEWRVADTLYSTEQLISIPNNSFKTRDVQLTTFNAIGCETVRKKSFEVYPLPVADFDSTFFCLDQGKQILNRSTISDNTPLNYTWIYNSEVISTEENPELTLDDSTNQNLELITTSFAGCKDTITKKVTIIPRPRAGFNFSTVCLGDPTLLQDTSVAPREIINYTWNLSNAVLTGKEVNFTFPQAGEYQVKFAIEDNKRCKDTLISTITIDSLPKASFENTLACENTKTTLINTSSASSDSISSVVWSIAGEGETLSGDQVDVIFSTEGSKLVQLNLLTKKGCASSTTKFITVNPSPISKFSISDSIGAQTLIVETENKSINAAETRWNISEVNVESSENNPVFSFTDLGQYTISLDVTSSEGCIDSSNKTVRVVNPIVDLILGNLSTEEENERILVSFDLTNMGNIPIQNTELSIDYGGIFSARELLNQQLLNNETNSFNISQTISKELFNSLNYICLETNTEENLAQEENLENNRTCLILKNELRVDRISPMPVRDQFIVRYFLPESTDVEIEIHNTLGKQVYSKISTNLSQGPHSETIDTGFLENDFYILTLKTPTETITRRISKL